MSEQLLEDVREAFLRHQHHLSDLPLVETYLARERASHGDRDNAITLMKLNLA